MVSKATVEVPRQLLIALGVLLAGALVALAFLLGRVSVGAPPSPATPEAALSESAGAVALARDSEPAASSPPVQPELQSPTTAPPAASAALPSATTPENERAAVAAYFAALDAVERQAKVWSDPQQLALQLMQQLVTGNSSGLDGLVASQRQARSQIAALVPPAICREHHTQVLQLMDESLALLAGLGQALTSADSTVLESFTAKARDLEARAKRVDAQGAELKRMSGL